jgi:hypothetical protein
MCGYCLQDKTRAADACITERLLRLPMHVLSQTLQSNMTAVKRGVLIHAQMQASAANQLRCSVARNSAQCHKSASAPSAVVP